MAASGFGSGSGLPPAFFGAGLYRCPACGGIWLSSQALLDHIYATHQINEAAASGMSFRKYRAIAPLPPAPPPSPSTPAAVPVHLGIMMVPLSPNPAFWEEYRWGGARPVEIDFLRLRGAPAVAAAAPEPEPQPQPPAVPNGDASESVEDGDEDVDTSSSENSMDSLSSELDILV